MSLYDPCKCTVRTGYENNTWFEVRSGVKQGKILSPLHFIAHKDDVTRVFKRNYVSRGNGDVMLYADDIALWSDRK